jgi:2,3-bisphosphoglycerate-dependent phosphoglycerate mutase
MSETLRDRRTEITPQFAGVRSLTLVRHGQSLWNAKNRFTGWTDVELTAQGRTEARATGARFRAANLDFDVAYCSPLKRTGETARIILDQLGLLDVTVHPDLALNERDYGELTGLNKAEAAERFGAEQVLRWRRSYAERPPGGESLRDAQARLLSFHIQTILPEVMAGRRALYVGHGNTVRALCMAFEGLSAEGVEGLEVGTGEALTYTFDESARVSRVRANSKANWEIAND